MYTTSEACRPTMPSRGCPVSFSAARLAHESRPSDSMTNTASWRPSRTSCAERSGFRCCFRLEPTLRIRSAASVRLLPQTCLGHLDQCPEGLRLADGQVGQHLAVDL